MERKLASIQIISDLKPIEGADKIEVATCLGWQCVVKKGEFKIGDKCIYWEIDSIVDSTNPIFEFMKERKFRVKTQKFLKTLSQGLLMPLSVLKHYGKIIYKNGEAYLETK